MKVDLDRVAAAVRESAETAREMPEAEVPSIVNSIVGRLGDHIEQEPEVKKAAHDHLHAAAGQLKLEGDTEQAPLVNALIGIGLALLANGEDAEAHYAASAG